MSSERPEAFVNQVLQNLNIYILYIFLQIFYCLTACLMRLVKRSGKLATATVLLLSQKCLEFHGHETVSILNILQCMHHCLTDFPLILLYRDHRSSVGFHNHTGTLRSNILEYTCYRTKLYYYVCDFDVWFIRDLSYVVNKVQA